MLRRVFMVGVIPVTILFTLIIGIGIVSSLPQNTTYTDVTAQVGISFDHATNNACSPKTYSNGSAWADYDNDGDMDLFLANLGGANALYRNEGDTNLDGLPDFIEVAASYGLTATTEASIAAVFVDYDNDGDQDLYVTHVGGNTLYQNQLSDVGSVSFIDVTASAGVADDGRALTVAWGDFDQDGYLDFYLAKHKKCKVDPAQEDHLYHNEGDGTFTDVTDYLCDGSAPCDQLNGLGFSAGWVDYDNDSDLDLYLVNDDIGFHYYPNVLWRNDGSDGAGGWLFTDVSVPSGTNADINGMGLGIGDYNNNGWQDFAFSNIGPNVLLENNGDGTFADISESAGITRTYLPSSTTESTTWGTVFFDHDNDTLLDLMFTAGKITPQIEGYPNAMFGNNGDGTFTDISASTGLDDPGRARHASIVDFDADGFVDVLISNQKGPAVLYHNDGNSNHWVTVTAEGTHSNRDGIGTRLWLETAGGVIQMRDITSGPTLGGGDERAAFFGMGNNLTGTLKVRWPDGQLQEVGVVNADQRIHLVEPARQQQTIYISSNVSGNLGDVAYADEDILGYNPNLALWYMVFDGSQVGLSSSDVDAFTFMSDGSVLFSLSAPSTLSDVGTVDDSDVIRFVPTSLGVTTAGTFELYLDGSSYDLTTWAEDIDAIGLAPNGDLVVSTLGGFDVTGGSGKDEDLIVLNSDTNSWTIYIDSSDFGLNTTNDEDVDGTWIDPETGEIYLSTKGLFWIPNISGGGSDLFTCAPGSLGVSTSCTIDTYWNGALHGLDRESTDTVVDGIAIGTGDIIYATASQSDSVGGITFQNEDILAQDSDLGVWYLVFDGSDFDLNPDLDGFTFMPDDSLLFSFARPVTLPDLGTVDDSDILRFVPGSYGLSTAGSIELYLDGSNYDLDAHSEDIDAISLTPDGELVVSTLGSFSDGSLIARDEDLILFDADAGTWSMYFDGSDVGFDTIDEDIDGVWIELATGDIYLSTAGAFSVTGLSGAGDDIFVCTPGALGDTTTCTYISYWEGAANGYLAELNGLAIAK